MHACLKLKPVCLLVSLCGYSEFLKVLLWRVDEGTLTDSASVLTLLTGCPIRVSSELLNLHSRGCSIDGGAGFPRCSPDVQTPHVSQTKGKLPYLNAVAENFVSLFSKLNFSTADCVEIFLHFHVTTSTWYTSERVRQTSFKWHLQKMTWGPKTRWLLSNSGKN